MIWGQLTDYLEKMSLISISYYNENIKVMSENIDNYLLEYVLELMNNFLSMNQGYKYRSPSTYSGIMLVNSL